VIAAIALLSVVLFVAAFAWLGVVPVARRAIAVAVAAVATLRDPAIGDDVRELHMRQGSLALLGAFLQIALRSVLALAAALLPVYLADWGGFVPREGVFAFLARADVIVAIAVATGLAWFLWARTWRKR